ncbi:outer membrane protein assembly factor BamE [Gammaproteobacteria bacterium]|nr:outer membrane protein assembly factor BamE [Gammaproteobacteria bacterium]
MKIFKQFFSSLIILLLIFSCSLPRVYEVVVSQGNLIDEDMMEKLEVGMTESQVKYVLGSPLIADTFTPNRWDYYTSVTQGNKKLTEKKITLYFKDKKLVSWEGEEPALLN